MKLSLHTLGITQNRSDLAQELVVVTPGQQVVASFSYLHQEGERYNSKVLLSECKVVIRQYS